MRVPTSLELAYHLELLDKLDKELDGLKDFTAALRTGNGPSYLALGGWNELAEIQFDAELLRGKLARLYAKL